MFEFEGRKYLSCKEASRRYGYSIPWFEHKRYRNLPPRAIKSDTGRVYYDLEETDAWFKDAMHITKL